MAYLPTPTMQILDQYLDYDPESGALSVKPEIQAIRPRLKFFFKVNKGPMKGQERVNLFGVVYAKKRICYKMGHGHDAIKPIKHANGDEMDFRLDNLELASGKPCQFRTAYREHEKALLYTVDKEDLNKHILKHAKIGLREAVSQINLCCQALTRIDETAGWYQGFLNSYEKFEALRDELIDLAEVATTVTNIGKKGRG